MGQAAAVAWGASGRGKRRAAWLRIKIECECDPLAARRFRPIECGVRLPNEHRDVLRPAFICHYADADRDFDRSFFKQDVEFIKGLKNALCHPLRLLALGAWEQGAKLVASPSAHKILIAQIVAERGGDGAEHGIARRMPVPVVDLLEMVDVEDRD
jgi:hypothetical protein